MKRDSRDPGGLSLAKYPLMSPSGFALQVVFTLVEAADDEYAFPGDRADASVWRRVFLRTGGMRRLLSLLQEGGGIDPSQVRPR